METTTREIKTLYFQDIADDTNSAVFEFRVDNDTKNSAST